MEPQPSKRIGCIDREIEEMNLQKKLPTGRLENSLKVKIDQFNKLSSEINDLEDLIAYNACPFERGETISFYRNDRKYHGIVTSIEYAGTRDLWKCRVKVKNRIHKPVVYARNLRP